MSGSRSSSDSRSIPNQRSSRPSRTPASRCSRRATRRRRDLLQKIDGVDLVFIKQRHPDYGEFIRVHLLRSKKDFYLFRLVLLMGAAEAPDQFRGRFVCVAGYLMNPVTSEKVNGLLHRLGLASISSRV